MPLEDLEGPNRFLDALNEAWPLNDDERPEGDDHIRGLKNTIINTFGRLAGYYDFRRVISWNWPAEGQPDTTGSLPMAYGTTAQRPPTPAEGDTRLNSSGAVSRVERWLGGQWRQVFPRTDDTQYWSLPQTFYPEIYIGGVDTNFATQPMKLGGDFREALGAGGNSRVLMKCWIEEMEVTALRLNGDEGGALFNAGLSGVYRGANRLLEENRSAFESAPAVVTAGGLITVAHGLAYRPVLYKAFLQCVVADAGYPVGAEMEFGTVCGTRDTQNNADSTISALFLDSDTSIRLQIGANGISAPNAGTGVFTRLTLPSWRAVIRAWA